MDYYGKLKELVGNGELEILYVMSPPRTLSTVLEIALAEYGDGQIHEPFHRRNRKDFNDGCRIVYQRVVELQGQLKRKNIKIVLKDISKYITPEEWKQLVELADRFVFTLREPSRQIFSLASRYANDVDGLEDDLNYQQIIANLPKIPFEDLAANYWENLLALLNITEEHLSTTPEKKYLAIISGATFKYDAEDSIKKLLARLELTVDPEKVLKGWNVGSGENFFKPNAIMSGIIEDKDIRKGPWLGRAINSSSFSSIDPKQDAPQDIDIYDNHLQDYFLKNILPAFVKMYLDENNICKPDISVVASKDFVKSDLAMANPIEAYLLTKSFSPQNSTQNNMLEQNSSSLRYIIKDSYPHIATALFDLTK